MKPNFETGSAAANEIIDEALVYQIDLLSDAVSGLDGIEETGDHDPCEWGRAFYADQDSEIQSVLEAEGKEPTIPPTDVPATVRDVFERIDIGYYEGDAAEIGSLELSKVVGVEAAFDVLGIEDPFTIVMGDCKSDLRVMRWVQENEWGNRCCPGARSQSVVDHAEATDDLVFNEGRAGDVLRAVYALNRFADEA